MSSTIALVRRLPWALLERLAIASVEVAVAATILSGSVVIGHALRDWRAWYWDPATTHPWAPTPLPRETAGAAAASAPATPVSVAAAPRPAPTPTPPCHPSAPGEMLAFANPVATGADCVWLAPRADGTHLVVASWGVAPTDLGVVGAPQEVPSVRVYTPDTWGAPVLVTVSAANAGGGEVLVLTWRSGDVMPLLRTNGRVVDVAADPAGWPRVRVARSDGPKTYAWNGRTYSSP